MRVCVQNVLYIVEGVFLYMLKPCRVRSALLDLCMLEIEGAFAESPRWQQRFKLLVRDLRDGSLRLAVRRGRYIPLRQARPDGGGVARWRAAHIPIRQCVT